MASQSAASSMSMLLWSVQSLADDLRLWQAVTLLSRQASVLPFVSKGVAVIGVLFTQFDVSLSLLHHGGRLGVRSLQSSVCSSRWLGALGCVLLGCGFWRASLVSNPSGGATAWSASAGSLLNPTSCLTLPALLTLQTTVYSSSWLRGEPASSPQNGRRLGVRLLQSSVCSSRWLRGEPAFSQKWQTLGCSVVAVVGVLFAMFGCSELCLTGLWVLEGFLGQ